MNWERILNIALFFVEFHTGCLAPAPRLRRPRPRYGAGGAAAAAADAVSSVRPLCVQERELKLQQYYDGGEEAKSIF